MTAKTRRYAGWIAAGLVLLLTVPSFGDPDLDHRGSARWGADYFPDVTLVTHQGKTVRFFEDLVEDKVVIINFIYTTCPDVCPLETARLAEVQEILGDRVGRDVFMYSIAIDPVVDTVEVLADYARRYQIGDGWLFLTGDRGDIDLLRRKLGLYIEEIQSEDSNDHNLSMIMGNQASARWMRRSPFENPYILATELGNWLHNGKVPSTTRGNSYENAPELRNLSQGESTFRNRCATCHTIGGGDISGAGHGNNVGPDLLDVTLVRDREWLTRWLKAPDEMLAEKDPTAMALFEQYNRIPMPNMSLGDSDVDALLDYLTTESRRVHKVRNTQALGTLQGTEPVMSCCEKNTTLAAAPETEDGAARPPWRGFSRASTVFLTALGAALCALAGIIRKLS